MPPKKLDTFGVHIKNRKRMRDVLIGEITNQISLVDTQ